MSSSVGLHSVNHHDGTVTKDAEFDLETSTLTRLRSSVDREGDRDASLMKTYTPQEVRAVTRGCEGR